MYWVEEPGHKSLGLIKRPLLSYIMTVSASMFFPFSLPSELTLSFLVGGLFVGVAIWFSEVGLVGSLVLSVSSS